MADIVELSGDIFQLDLKECGYDGRTAGYFVRGKSGWLLVETGPASSFETINEAVKLLKIKSEQLKYIAVTHIHLDHAGGLGVVSKHFKNSRVILHPKGARHMINPSRLIAGALDFWGKKKMEQYGEVVPVAEEKVMAVTEGDVIDLGDRQIEVWETPGHAKNHVCYYDTKTNGVFSGDAIGVFSPKISLLLGRPVMRPATPAPDFNGELMINSLTRMAMSKLEKIYFTHFGVGEIPQLLIENILGQLMVFMQMGRNYIKNSNLELFQLEMERYTREALLGPKQHPEISDRLTEQEWDFQVNMIKMSAGGIWQYLNK